jgi:hypothetical protein
MELPESDDEAEGEFGGGGLAGSGAESGAEFRSESGSDGEDADDDNAASDASWRGSDGSDGGSSSSEGEEVVLAPRPLRAPTDEPEQLLREDDFSRGFYNTQTYTAYLRAFTKWKRFAREHGIADVLTAPLEVSKPVAMNYYRHLATIAGLAKPM